MVVVTTFYILTLTFKAMEKKELRIELSLSEYKSLIKFKKKLGNPSWRLMLLILSGNQE